MPKPNGVIVYEGPSAFDGSPIAVILTGFATGSTNVKTGRVIQSWILRTDVEPHTALREGLDPAVCGDCKHRSRASGGSSACYVRVFQAPLGIYRAYHRGSYPRVSITEACVMLAEAGATFRLGAYGDPAAAPIPWAELAEAAGSHTGYTHAWHRPEGASLRGLCMASADTLEEARTAAGAGWAYFRVTEAGDRHRERGEARCPA